MFRCLVCIENTPNTQERESPDVDLVDDETISLCSAFCIALKLNFSRYQSQLYKAVFCNECKKRLKEVPSILSIPNSIDEDDEVSSKIKQIMLDGYLAQMDREIDNNSNPNNKELDCPFQSTRLEILKELGLVVELDDEPNPLSPEHSEYRNTPVTSSYNSKLPLYIDLELDEEIPPDEILLEDEDEEKEEEKQTNFKEVDDIEKEDKELNSFLGIQNEEETNEIHGEEMIKQSVEQESFEIPNNNKTQEPKIQAVRPLLPEGIIFVPQPRAVSIIAAEKIKSVFAASSSNKMKDKSGTNLLLSASTASSSLETPKISNINNKTIGNKKTKNSIKVLDINGRTIKMKKSTKEKTSQKKKIYIRTKKNKNHSMSKSSKENKTFNEMPALSSPYLEDSELDSSEVDTRINEDDIQIEMPQLNVEIENVSNKKKLKKLALSDEKISIKKRSKHEDVSSKATELSYTKNSKNTKSLKKSKYHKSSSSSTNSNQNNKNNLPLGVITPRSKLPIEYRSCSVVIENFSIEQIAEAASKNNVKIPSIITESSKINADDKSVSKKSSISPIKAKEKLPVSTITTTKELSLSSSSSASPTKTTTSTSTAISETLSVHVPKNIMVESVPNIMSPVEQTSTSITQPIVNDNVISSTTSVINSITPTINTVKSNATDMTITNPINNNNVSTVVNSSIPNSTIKFCNTVQNNATNTTTTYATNRKSKRKPLKPIKGICATTLLPSQNQPQQQKLQVDNTHHQSLLSMLPEQNSQNPMQQMEMQINAKSQNETSNDKSIIVGEQHVPSSLPPCVHTVTASTIISATNSSTTTSNNNNNEEQEAQIQLSTKSNSNINGSSSQVNNNCIPSENKTIKTKILSDKSELNQNQGINNNNNSNSPRKTFSPSKNVDKNIHINTTNDKNNNEVKDKESKMSSSLSLSTTTATELKSKPKGPPYLPLKISVSEIEKVTAVPQKIPLLKRKVFSPSKIHLGPSIIRLEDATRAVSAVVNDFHRQVHNNSNEQVSNISENVSKTSSPFKNIQNPKVTEPEKPKIPKLTINITNMTKHISGNSIDPSPVYMIKSNGSVPHDNDNDSDSLLSNNHDSNDDDDHLNDVDVDNNDEDDRMSEISDSELGFLQEETNRFKFGLRPRRETIMKIKTALESDSESDKSIKSKDSDNTESDPMFSERYRKKKKLKATNTLNKLSKLYGSAQSTNYGIIIKKRKNKYERDVRRKKQDAEKNQEVNHSKESSSYSCDKCQSQFSKKSKFKTHLRQHERDLAKKLSCEICGKGFHYAAKLMLHKKLHSDKKEFGCNLCPRSFTSKQYLDIHNRNHPPPSMELNHFPCDQCPASFGHLSTLREHQRSHSGQLPFQCDMCNQRFPFLSRLKRHQSVKHFNLKPYECRYCGIAFKQAGNLKCHESRHDEKNKKLQCPYPKCSLRFFDPNKLKDHIKVHSREKSYNCKQCLKKFRLSSSLKTHVSTTHGKKKPYICRICHKQFAQKQYLNYHQKSHPELRAQRYFCPENGCGRSFSELSNLREHARKHTDDFPFKCELCEYKVAYRSRLAKHMLRHTTEKNFECEICHKKFALEAYRIRHMKNIHFKNKEDEVEDHESTDEEEEEEEERGGDE